MRSIISRRLGRGFTLLEVLIAVLVFSIGLLGVAGMVLASMRGTHTAQIHTQAALLAQWIGDAMRANPAGVVAGNYNGTAPSSGSVDCSSGCTPAQTANSDMTNWGVLLARSLPSGQGTIRCDLTAAVGDDQPTFPVGLCTISMTWSESDETRNTGATAGTAVAITRKSQRFDWIINP
jgi:type IV pilus assembly protein PilV